MNALFSIYLALLEPGDEVLLPTPGFPNMDEMVRLLGGEPVFYRLDRDAGLPARRASSSSRSSRRGRRRSSPTRPATRPARVFPAETVRGLAELAAERGIWLISDEVYDELILDDEPHVSAAALVPDAPIVSVYSFSKVYAMTGWRLGYCAAPPELAAVLRKLQEPRGLVPVGDLAERGRGRAARARATSSTRCATPTARGATAPSRPPRHGLGVFRTQGTFYMLVDIVRARACRRASSRCGCSTSCHVAVAPGEVFGPGRRGPRPHLVRGRGGRARRGHRAGSRGPSRRSRHDARTTRWSSSCARGATSWSSSRASSSRRRAEPARRRARCGRARRRQKLRELGVARVETAARARSGRTCSRGRAARSRTLILGGHLDTKPPGDLAEWRARPVRRGDRGRRAPRRRLRRHEGRGRGDGVRAAALEAARPRTRRVTLVLTADEEAGVAPRRQWLAETGQLARRRGGARRAVRDRLASGRRSTPSRAARRSSRCACAARRCTRASPTGCRP